ncbi:uncharacterized protein with gpF-like domain [Acinetobacter sp. BIGb0196]|nr:uncharacterized protein with gpF-like domain [Acinetobacter guillouiae]MCW2252846.1 uncharacterized protein with gpF-like domain [Acinetobacter sp. BIGb0204]NII36386.1 uncharacterized protein with gpF-like domain [Acinetobacter sp. BIGb0196]
MALGVESYKWQIVKDDRVRLDHQHKHDKSFRWDAPPSGGHLGEAICCRCVVLPNYDDIWVD